MNKEDILVMSHEELKRLELVKKVLAKELKQTEVSELLGISYRQTKRIVKKIRELGVKGAAHQLRGRTNCRRFSEDFKRKVLAVYVRRYKGFGCSLACEKLIKHEGIKINRETLRGWLFEEGHMSRRRLRRKHRLWRERRAYSGEMIQMDGSHHDWLEDRGPRLVLMGYIDDATNRIFGRFYEYEGTIPAMDSFKRYCLKHGIPVSVYLDKHTTYKSNKRDLWKLSILGQGDGLSEFERALSRLDVRVIHANTPQAKGRIERLFRTLQDRLVKELRLANARTMEEANRVLEGYLIEHNKRYRVEARKKANLHRPTLKAKELDEILCIKKEHMLRNDFTVMHNNRLYQVLKFTSAKKLEVREYVNGRMCLIGPNQGRLEFKEIIQRPLAKAKEALPRQTRRDRIKNFINNSK